MTKPEIRTALPPDHALRQRLNDEVHARPPERIVSPARVSFVAVVADAAQREKAWAMLTEVAARHRAPAPAANGFHYSADFGGFRLKA